MSQCQVCKTVKPPAAAGWLEGSIRYEDLRGARDVDVTLCPDHREHMAAVVEALRERRIQE